MPRDGTIAAAGRFRAPGHREGLVGCIDVIRVGRKDAFRKEGNGTGKFGGKTSQGKFTPKRKGNGGLDIGDIIDAVGGLLPGRN